MDDNLVWQNRRLIETAAAALKRHGFAAQCFDNRAEAVNFLVEQAAGCKSVGFGGSMTLSELELPRRIDDIGLETLVHGRTGLTPVERRRIMQQQLNCDLFFTGTNAVTLDGSLINIDATGNRVCSMAFGPPRVWVVAGANKICTDIADGLKRVKKSAAPPNAKRLGFKTPCAETGICSDCNSPDRICRITTIIERAPRATALGVCLINETLGY